jgi:hypothetical protein
MGAALATLGEKIGGVAQIAAGFTLGNFVTLLAMDIPSAIGQTVNAAAVFGDRVHEMQERIGGTAQEKSGLLTVNKEIEFTEAEIELLDDLIGRALTRQGIAQRYRGHEAVVYSITDKVTHAKGPDPIGRTSRQRLSDLRPSETDGSCLTSGSAATFMINAQRSSGGSTSRAPSGTSSRSSRKNWPFATFTST